MRQTIRVQQNLNIPAVLFLVFLVLKLTDSIDWSWVWVTSPLWIAFAIQFLIFMILYFKNT